VTGVSSPDCLPVLSACLTLLLVASPDPQTPAVLGRALPLGGADGDGDGDSGVCAELAWDSTTGLPVVSGVTPADWTGFRLAG